MTIRSYRDEATSGYSGRPLLQKLGYSFDKVSFVDKTAPYFQEVAHDITLGADVPYDFIHIFVKNQAELHTSASFAISKLSKTGTLWISWPKKAAKTQTDLDANIVQKYGLELGVVDVKVAAIDDVWSGLKFVYRLKDRG